MPHSVDVAPRYVRRARQLAKKRNQSFEQAEAYNNDEDTWGTEPERRNFVGLMGEFAFAEYADLKVDTSTRKWSDGGYDFDVLLDGERTRIDVKTAQKKPQCLMIKENAVNADYYILAHLKEDTVDLYGGASRQRVLNGLRKESYRFDHTNLTLGLHSLDPLPDPEQFEPL